MSTMGSGMVERLLADRIGLDPSSVGDGLIARAVDARMLAIGLRSQADYERILLGSIDELQALVEEVVVPESWFFRDVRPFEALADFARSGWLTDPTRPPLSALSIPCAGGEEPYSIALTLLETGLTSDRFRVDAVDVSSRSIARAIAGVFTKNAFRGQRSAIRPGDFRELNGVFTIDPAVRSTVRFHLGNLLDPTLFADRSPFDVIFCRNLLIYFKPEARAQAFATLGRLLVDGGLLFLGHADRPDDSKTSPFQSMADKGNFAFRKGLAKVSLPRPAPIKRQAAISTPCFRPAITKSEIVRKPPAPRSDEAVLMKVELSGSILDRASSLADLGQYDEARRLVDRSIADGGANASAYFLLGLIDQASGTLDRAEAHFLKTIYLDPQHDEALLSLALLAGRRGDLAAEAVYRRRAGRVLARKRSS